MWNTLILTWSKSCVISSATGKTKFSITDTKLSLRFVTLSTEDNIIIEAISICFNWNKWQSKQTDQEQNRILDYLIDSSFQGVNRLFVLLFENRSDGTNERNKRNKRL